ncbi:DUF427 domain-containing protein [Streptomyces sp. NPDC097619]|uniref:DUF427 domain-containing protein n=1 Tax=Streptomyces sp. NPDC097619 TaxID=3157228 RepID=UPI0033252D2C
MAGTEDGGPPRRAESVWDYPRPPRLEPDDRRVTVREGGLLLADSTRCLRILETSHPPVFYVPPEDVRTDLLLRSGRTSWCEWKGTATYWDLRAGSGRRSGTGSIWSYESPSPGYAALAGHFAFYAVEGRACEVAGERVTPQPGDFYGGWITHEITGPFKGGPDTTGW